MRKPPLIALSAFTALGVSALAGSTTGSFNSVLTGAHSAKQQASSAKALDSSFKASHGRADRSKTSPTLSIRGGRDLRAAHDVHLVNRSDLSNATGLPVHPAASHATLTTAQQPATQQSSSPVVAPATNPTPQPAAPAGGVWYELRMCESSDNYAEDSGNGYYGAYQFALSTWYGLGYSGLPSDAPPAVQDQAAAELQARSGWDQWPQCAAELGLY